MVIIYTGVSGRGLNTRPSAGSRTSDLDLGLPLSARKMRLLSSLYLGLALFLGLSDARIISKDEVRERQREAVKRWAAPGPAEFLPMEKRATVKNITFKNPRASGMLGPLEPVIPYSPSLQSSSSTGRQYLRLASMWDQVGPAYSRSAALPMKPVKSVTVSLYATW